jgi:hypothetical protein
MRSSRLLLYGVAGAIALAELAILALALRPEVHPDYRAFYIDQTTTCLPRDPGGAYALGETVAFLPGKAAVKTLVGCGWDGPAGNGLHSVGMLSQLHLNARGTDAMELTLEVTAANSDRPQRVDVLVDGEAVGSMRATSSDAAPRASFPVPSAALADGRIDITLGYPDAFLPRPLAPETDRRAIRLLSLRLAPRALPSG